MPRRDGGPVEPDHAQDLAALRRPLPPLPRHADRRLARPRAGRGLRHHGEADGANAQAVYDAIAAQTGDARVPAARAVRALQHRGAGHHRRRDRSAGATTGAIRASGWDGRVVPTFRPDAVVNLLTPGWRDNLGGAGPRRAAARSAPTRRFIAALEDRRAFFKQMGATATDHAADTAYTARLDAAEAEAIFAARAARRGDRRRRAALHRPHADGDGAHEHRGRPGDAAPRRLAPQPQRPGPRALRRG